MKLLQQRAISELGHVNADTLKTKPRERINGVVKCRLYRFPPFVLSSYDIGILLSGCLSLMEWSRELLLLVRDNILDPLATS